MVQIKNNKDFQKLDYNEIKNFIPSDKLNEFRVFFKELNTREYEVRFKKSTSFDNYKLKGDSEYIKYGFSINGKSVPYFHPNRSFHDEIIWLNKNVFYNEECKLEDKLINAAIVKFYGPSETVRIITEGSGKSFIKYDYLINDEEYLFRSMNNLQTAARSGQKIYGTTELRTSLQTEGRNYTRLIETPYDKAYNLNCNPLRTSRTSDILYWFTHLGPKMKDFYSTKPTMEESFNFLTSFKGIGNYYGYHFSTNLARLPEIGTLIEPGYNKGNIDENDDFVAPGVGAMNTINWFFGNCFDMKTINSDSGAHFIRLIRDNQKDFFGVEDDTYKNILETVSETGNFTTFGCEISCCQFGVFRRIKEDKKMASKRADAPISKEK